MQISSIGKQPEPEESNLKKYILIALIASIILLVVVVIVMMFLKANYKEVKELALIVDGKTKNIKSEDTFLFDNDGNLYVSLIDIDNAIGYRHEYGDLYNGNAEDKTKCSMVCNEERTIYELTSNKIYKSLEDGNNVYTEFTIEKPVQRKNGKLYVISSGLELGCNLKIKYDESENQIIIKTLPELYKAYNDKATAGEYANVDMLDDDFVNKKAILYGMLVVKANIKGGEKYGVISSDGKAVLSTKYDELEFIESSQDFFVKGNGKYGLIARNGTQKIAMDYEELKVLDSKTNLYYVLYNGKKGVLDKYGKAKIYAEYDELGINSKHFPSNNIKNPMLFYDNCIPVKKDNRWGFFDTSGNLISNFYWDSLGYVESTENGKNSRNILLVEYKNIYGIVVCQNGRYGIINSVGEQLVACVFDKIYSETSSGEEIYYLEFQGRSTELGAYLRDKGIDVKDPEKEDYGYNDVIDLDATPDVNLDLETPNIIKNTPTPVPQIVFEEDENSVEQQEYDDEEF